MRIVLLRVKSNGDLYPLSISQPIFLFFIHQSVDISHGRLGHAISRILDKLHPNTSIIQMTNLTSNCGSCCLGKSTRLPYFEVEHCFDIPLYLIHGDLLQSPVYSNKAYKYYILFFVIFLATLVYIQCTISLMGVEFSLNFKNWLKIFCIPRLSIFKVMVVENTIIIPSLATWSNKKFIFVNVLLILSSRMASLNESINIK